MQAFFGENREAVKAFRATLSEARFSTYLKAANNNENFAIGLYHWNALLSQSLYLPLQMWEVALRNRLNGFLIWKYGRKWPFEERVNRQMAGQDRKRLREAIERQEQSRGKHGITTDAIVADLSAGFWVSLLTKSYDIPFSWRYNLARVFPYEPQIGRDVASRLCGRLLDVRNRVAHHEPIFGLPLPDVRTELERLTKAMCGASYLYTASTCTFAATFSARPTS